MSEAENHPPASSVTALRIPIIKKGEYDLWCMKMRQYIAITDHILWDIITNGDQATTEPASSSSQPSAPKTSIVVNARRNNEKALNILLSAIPDRHLLSFHDDQDARSLWDAIKARFGGNKESKKMQKNLLEQQFETFVVGAKEELDSAYDRFQNIISMLELYDAKVSYEDQEEEQGRKKVSDGSTGLNEVDVNSGDAQVFEGTFEDFEGTAEVYEGTDKVIESTAEVIEGTAKVNKGTDEVNESTVGE
ncbi:hypothetical protein Tco_1069215, partial [Tanacetum coccineum]